MTRSRLTQEALSELVLLERDEPTTTDRRAKTRGAAIFCGWLALLGLVLALASGVGPWRTCGLVVLAVFAGGALRLAQLLLLAWDSEGRPPRQRLQDDR
jgi:hypothetical protein